MTLLERRPLAETLAPGTKAESAPARLIDRIAELWASGASMRSIATSIGDGVGRGAVAGAIDRARRNGDAERFPARPGPSREETKQHRLEADRARYRRAHPLALRRVAADAAPVVEAPESQLHLLLWEIPIDGCCYPTNSVPAGRGIDLRFCGRRVDNGRGKWCAQCRARVYRPVVGRMLKRAG